ncbi:MAG: toprim domain-containing protein [archaeon]
MESFVKKIDNKHVFNASLPSCYQMQNIDISYLLEEIEKAKSTQTLFIVEGHNDKKALNNLGIDNVAVIKESKKSIKEFLEDVASRNKEVVILTDLDTEGKKLYNLARNTFSSSGVKIAPSIREELFRLKVSHIEGLDSFVENHLP